MFKAHDQMALTSYNLFLDDLCNPDGAYLYDEGWMLTDKSGIPTDKWVVVRDYAEFCLMVKHMLPKTVSFDHDLHEEHIIHYFSVTQSTGVIEYGNLKNLTGRACAQYLVQQCEAAGVPLPKCYIHSANEWGRKEIAKVLYE